MKYTILTFCFSLIFSISTFAQTEKNEKEKDTLFNKESKTFTVLPLVTNNPAMKTGFGVMPMYFFKLKKNDTISPPSMVTIYGVYTTNKSHIIIPAARLFWNEDKNRLNVAAGNVRINNDFEYNIEGQDIQLVFSEVRSILVAEYSRKIIGNFYLGALYMGMNTNYKFDQGTEEENEFTKEFFEENGIEDNFVSSVGINFSFDNRNYVYYPTSGFNISIRPKFNREWLGSDNDYVDTDYTAAYYRGIGSKGVLAIGLAGGFATGDVPFDGYQSYGMQNSLRGYTTGKYRGKYMIAFQGEYRRTIYKRWGGVVFAGGGSVWGNDREEETFERSWLPSAGLGVRFMASREKKINLRLDYAIGVDGNQGLYFGIMEAF